VFLSYGSSKALKKRFTTKIVSKGIYKTNRQKIQNHFFLDFFNHVFGRFSVRGVQKRHLKNIEKTNLTLVLFWPLTHPPTTGVMICFWRPLACPPGPGPGYWGRVGGWVCSRGFFGGRWWVGGWELGVFSAF
jgi:hypothetical protein